MVFLGKRKKGKEETKKCVCRYPSYLFFPGKDSNAEKRDAQSCCMRHKSEEAFPLFRAHFGDK